MKMNTILKLLRFWPPYWGAGVRVLSITPDLSELVVEMKLGLLNKNYMGTHFGGSLYSMVDPFYCLMLIHHLGKEYVVWDKAASIDFLKASKLPVRAEFKLTPEFISEIKARVAREGKILPELKVNIVDRDGVLVATVSKTLYIRSR